MKLTNIDPNLIKSACNRAIRDFDMRTQIKINEFVNRNNVVTRRKYFFFGKPVQHILTKAQVYDKCPDYIDMILADRNHTLYLTKRLLDTAQAANAMNCSVALDENELNLIKDYLWTN